MLMVGDGDGDGVATTLLQVTLTSAFPLRKCQMLKA